MTSIAWAIMFVGTMACEVWWELEGKAPSKTAANLAVLFFAATVISTLIEWIKR